MLGHARSEKCGGDGLLPGVVKVLVEPHGVAKVLVCAEGVDLALDERVVPLNAGNIVEGRLDAIGLAAGVVEEGSVAVADAVDAGGDEANAESVGEIEDGCLHVEVVSVGGRRCKDSDVEASNDVGDALGAGWLFAGIDGGEAEADVSGAGFEVIRPDVFGKRVEQALIPCFCFAVPPGLLKGITVSRCEEEDAKLAGLSGVEDKAEKPGCHLDGLLFCHPLTKCLEGRPKIRAIIHIV